MSGCYFLCPLLLANSDYTLSEVFGARVEGPEMNLDLQTVGVAAVVVLLLLDKVLGMLKARGVDLPAMSKKLDKVADSVRITEAVVKEAHSRVKHLDELHSVYDGMGTPVWYIDRPSLQTAIARLGESIDSQNGLLTEQVLLLKQILSRAPVRSAGGDEDTD